MTEYYKHYINGELVGEAPACPKSSEIIEGFGDSAVKDIIASPTLKELGVEEILQQLVDDAQEMGFYDDNKEEE